MLLPSIFENDFRDSIFDDMFRVPFIMKEGNGINQMHSDIKEREDGYQIEMNLPGFAKENISAEIKEGYLTIKAIRTEENNEKSEDGKYIRRERFSGSCQRSFFVGKEVKEEDIKAKFKDGVLFLQIPKKEAIPMKEEKRNILIEG